jgi:hypothetical protein
MSTPQTEPGSLLAYVRPTRSTLFWRTFWPWQLLRFLIINVRMTRMILKSHDTKLGARQAPP